MTFVFTQEALLIALGIFALRVLNQSLDTLRVMMMMRGRSLLTWLLGFAETVIFVITLSTVINDLNNILNIIAYSAGFATGNVTGLWIEGRLALGHIHIRVVSPKRGSKVAETLRAEGYAVTEIPARGRDGAGSQGTHRFPDPPGRYLLRTARETRSPLRSLHHTSPRPARRRKLPAVPDPPHRSCLPCPRSPRTVPRPAPAVAARRMHRLPPAGTRSPAFPCRTPPASNVV